MRRAVEGGCYLELNAQPDRLDLIDSHCRLAKQLSLKVAISTDAHSVVELDFMRFGIDQARRGWLEGACRTDPDRTGLDHEILHS
jgi:DNA polymerase (family 10)